ncbi:MAG: hypothetical protein ACLFR1_05375 [Spirochaetia bacterium]
MNKSVLRSIFLGYKKTILQAGYIILFIGVIAACTLAAVYSLWAAAIYFPSVYTWFCIILCAILISILIVRALRKHYKLYEGLFDFLIHGILPPLFSLLLFTAAAAGWYGAFLLMSLISPFAGIPAIVFMIIFSGFVLFRKQIRKGT